ncbi:hypothetical protein M422DRAFT_257531 [Sphaerobolus stellatus SS14]|uniref:CCHC-type domain-containing protein n=1 Tax=Sphaerobolus stellatus (strain SS14) TaxID=990650 RepID=A0A0C9VE75_SPHS4|nr:hypothetical protein M422DRAFT_257531 [Sphaerobolus stellatus SS14]
MNPEVTAGPGPGDSTNMEADKLNFIWNSMMQLSSFSTTIAKSHQAWTEAVAALSRMAATPSTASPGNPPTIKFKEPTAFKGKPEEVEGFLYLIADGIAMQERAFTSHTQKVTYMGSYLADGAPKAWLTGIRKHSPQLLHDYDRFIAAFKPHFESSACEAFYKGLKDEIKDAFCIRAGGRPKTLDKLESEAISVDANLYARRLEKASRQAHNSQATPSMGSAPCFNTNSASSSSQYAPMEVNSVQTGHGRLTQEECECRMKENLCLYCGTAGHVIRSCPKIPPDRHQPQVSAILADPQDPQNSQQEKNFQSEAH